MAGPCRLALFPERAVLVHIRPELERAALLPHRHLARPVRSRPPSASLGSHQHSGISVARSPPRSRCCDQCPRRTCPPQAAARLSRPTGVTARECAPLVVAAHVSAELRPCAAPGRALGPSDPLRAPRRHDRHRTHRQNRRRLWGGLTGHWPDVPAYSPQLPRRPPVATRPAGNPAALPLPTPQTPYSSREAEVGSPSKTALSSLSKSAIALT